MYAPRFFIVFRPLAETVMVIFLLSSGMKSVFFWRLIWRRRLPVGLNLVARVRLEYPPPTWERLPVMSHVLAIHYFNHDVLPACPVANAPCPSVAFGEGGKRCGTGVISQTLAIVARMVPF